jgi:NADPH:quinone reductase-like Zn-dependent oxidoreductase
VQQLARWQQRQELLRGRGVLGWVQGEVPLLQREAIDVRVDGRPGVVCQRVREARGRQAEVLFDLVANKSLAECRAVLVPGGRYVPCAGSSGDWLGPVGGMLWGMLSSLFSSKKYKASIQALGQADLLVLKELVEAGKVRPVVEKVWPLGEVAAALEHVGAGHSRGLNVLRVSA